MEICSELTSREADCVFQPAYHRKLALPTHLVMSFPLRGLAEEGVPHSLMPEYYRRRAEQGVGLIVTEPAAVDEVSAGEGLPAFFGGAAFRAWKRVTATVHDTPCRVAASLFCAADIPAELGAVVAAYGRAAEAARCLGFDALEIDAGEGSLPETWLGEGRVLPLVQVLLRLRRVVGWRFALLLRVQPAAVARSVADVASLLRPLAEAGVDMFHVVSADAAAPAWAGAPLSMAGLVKHLTGRPVIAEGGVGEDVRQQRFLICAQRLHRGEIDYIAVGRALMTDPAWAEKLRQGRCGDIIPFSRCAAKRLY